MGEVSAGIRARWAGSVHEREPHVRPRDRILLGLLVAAGVLSLYFFAEYWFGQGLRREPTFFLLLSFAVFWNPARNLRRIASN